MSLEGPPDDGLVPPDANVLLEQRKLEIEAEAEKAAESEPELTEEEEEEVVDLLVAGKKDRVVTVFGRVIHLQTLTIAEELKVSQITKPYIGSDGWGRATRTAVVAAAIRTIDGELLFNPLSKSDFDEIISKKFDKLMDWYPLGVDQIYKEYVEMEKELADLVKKLGK